MGGKSDPSSNYSNTGNREADEVSNRSGGGYDEKDAGKETGSSSREASRAWHEARDAADVRDKDK